MIIKEKEKLHTIQVSSLDELREALPDVHKNNGVATHFVSLAVNNAEIRVCPFQLDRVDEKGIKNRLLSDAVESLSLPANAIELDYCVFDSTDDKTRGVFVCFPKQLLQDHLSIIDQSGYVPVKIVPSILAGIESFLHQKKGEKGRICLFDFSGDNMIYFAVFSNGHCDFLREIPYENTDEIEHEVIQSLRCACSVSSIKKFDHIYFSGNVSNKDHLIKRAKDLFCNDVTCGYFTDVESSLKRDGNGLALNLIKDKTFTLSQRKIINQAILTGLFLCGLIIMILSVKVVITQLKINNAGASYRTSDYNYAQDLQRRLKAL